MRFQNKSLLVLTCLCGLAAGMASGAAIADSQAPSQPNGVSAQAIDSSSVRVSWNQPWDNVGIEGYNVYRNNQYYATVFNTNYIDYAVTNGSYEYAIVAFDAAKNYTSLSAKAAVTVGGGNSSQAAVSTNNNQNLAVPSALRATVQSGNEAIIYWTAPQGDVKGYNIYRDGGYISSTSSTEYRDTQLGWGQDHRYYVVAYNHNNTFSEKSAELLVNTNNNRSAEQILSDPVQAAPAPVQQTGGVPDGYRQVFADEFQQYSLDPNKWNSQYRWGPWLTINNEQQFYVNSIHNPDFGHSPFSFDGENMTISAIRTPEHLRSSANWKPYISGALTTYNKFKMKYVYVEIRAKLPKGKGLWSAFWLLHNNENDRRPEIDVVEYIGDKPTVAYNTYHYYDQNGNLQSSPTMEAWGPDYSQEFHTYAVKWEPGLITWYVDGVERNTYQNGNAAWEDMYLLVNLAVGGAWAGNPDGSTPFPARMTIDYIRAYQKN